VIAVLVAVAMLLLGLMAALMTAKTPPGQTHPAGPALRDALRQRVITIGDTVLVRFPDLLGRDAILRRLQWAGEPMGVAEYLGSRLVAVAGGLLVGWSLLGATPLALGGAVVGLYLPEMWLNGEIKKRQQHIERDLVQFVGLWHAAAEAGLDLMPAIDQIVRQVEGPLAQGPLTAEFRRAAQQVSIGYSVSVALNQLAERCGVPELTGVINYLVMADRYGTGVVEPLRQAELNLLAQRTNQARSRAGAVNVALRGPMFMMIVGMIIFLMGPVVLMLKGM
jgi:tight adherence protein C